MAVKMNQNQRRIQRASKYLILWKNPIATLTLFAEQCIYLLRSWCQHGWSHRKIFILGIIIMTVLMTMCESYLQRLWVPIKWIFLGILSSIGFGTGLPTFVLFLAPFTAKVTLAAQECGTVNFPSPPYPDKVVCPIHAVNDEYVTIWMVLNKVRLEAMMWGAGTALGELPPYLLARSSRTAEDELQNENENASQQRNRIIISNLIKKIGFFGILILASLPNPLFDVAGITCGRFLVPFWTFFGATLIGKAVIKIHLQELFVIAAFNKTFGDKLMNFLAKFPVVGEKIQELFEDYVENQKRNLHQETNIQDSTWMGFISEIIVGLTFLYFLTSIVHSMAVTCYKRKLVRV